MPGKIFINPFSKNTIVRSSIEYSIAIFRYRFILLRRMIACGDGSIYDCRQPVKITLWLIPGTCIRIIQAALDQ